jgi:hypothetical protein
MDIEALEKLAALNQLQQQADSLDAYTPEQGPAGDREGRALPYTNVERVTRLWEGATLAAARGAGCTRSTNISFIATTRPGYGGSAPT